MVNCKLSVRAYNDSLHLVTYRKYLNTRMDKIIGGQLGHVSQLAEGRTVTINNYKLLPVLLRYNLLFNN